MQAGVFTSPPLGAEHLLWAAAPGASAHHRDGPVPAPCPAGHRPYRGPSVPSPGSSSFTAATPGL